MNKARKQGHGIELEHNKLLSEQEILEECENFDMDGACGVYFLIKNGRVSYVGQSVNVYARLAVYKKDVDFDKFCYIHCPKQQLNLLESIYIHLLRPPMNKEDKKKRHAPMTMDQILSKIYMKEENEK